MPEESKAQKLAAARKKLKEYQTRSGFDAHSSSAASVGSAGDVADTMSVSSNISEHSDSEINLNVLSNTDEQISFTPSDCIIEQQQLLQQVVNVEKRIDKVTATATITPFISNTETTAATANQPAITFSTTTTTIPMQLTPSTVGILNSGEALNSIHQQHQLNAMQLLIADKTQLTSDLTKCLTQCRAKDLELEELRVQYENMKQRLEDSQQRFVTQQISWEKLRNMNAELQHKLAQASARDEEHTVLMHEMQQELNTERQRAAQCEQQYKEQCNAIEMFEIRLRQLTDETNVTRDDRVESLTQTQFMHEQQIRDLQAMVQQLTVDKEQMSTQYQNYVQHLKSELCKLTEKNSELTDESSRLQEHERQLVDHISALERDIQRKIHRNEQVEREEEAEKQKEVTAISDTATATKQAMIKLQEQVNELQFERHEFQLKIKSQEDRLQQMENEHQQRQNELELLQEQLTHQPDPAKLLATMESDKVAASRALIQNAEIKKQLNELEQRFVQLTNDKADLMNRLDSEQFANREMHSNYEAMKERLSDIDERFRFKDEEMIRLSHENIELSQQIVLLTKQLKTFNHKLDDEQSNNRDHDSGHHKFVYSLSEHIHSHDDGDSQDDHDKHVHSYNKHDHDNYKHSDCNNEDIDSDDHNHTKNCTQAVSPQLTHIHHTPAKTQHIPTEEAIGKLQERFTKLMSQVADLTDEKQRLEHLVLQLQGETETIGEYITLYQTQRRMLKQREYEKAAQMRLLQTEREQMREKIAILNNLVSSLGIQLPQTEEHATDVLAVAETFPNVALLPSSTATSCNNNIPECDDSIQQIDTYNGKHQREHFNTNEAQVILSKIQNIISEIKEDTEAVPFVPSVDHLNCCLGKFEVV